VPPPDHVAGRVEKAADQPDLAGIAAPPAGWDPPARVSRQG
jgi:hypothetical protein